jgi:hypothetical protein
MGFLAFNPLMGLSLGWNGAGEMQRFCAAVMQNCIA